MSTTIRIRTTSHPVTGHLSGSPRRTGPTGVAAPPPGTTATPAARDPIPALGGALPAWRHHGCRRHRGPHAMRPFRIPSPRRGPEPVVGDDARGPVGAGAVAAFRSRRRVHLLQLRAALDPNNDLFLSLLGFTFGVSLCEEVCKAPPLAWGVDSGTRATPEQPSARLEIPRTSTTGALERPHSCPRRAFPGLPGPFPSPRTGVQ